MSGRNTYTLCLRWVKVRPLNNGHFTVSKLKKNPFFSPVWQSTPIYQDTEKLIVHVQVWKADYIMSFIFHTLASGTLILGHRVRSRQVLQIIVGLQLSSLLHVQTNPGKSCCWTCILSREIISPLWDTASIPYYKESL